MKNKIYVKDPFSGSGINIATYHRGIVSMNNSPAVLKQLDRLFTNAPGDVISTKILTPKRGSINGHRKINKYR